MFHLKPNSYKVTTINTEGKTGNNTDYIVTFEKVNRNDISGYVMSHHQKVPLVGKYDENQLTWTEKHKQAGTYNNNYTYITDWKGNGNYFSHDGYSSFKGNIIFHFGRGCYFEVEFSKAFERLKKVTNLDIHFTYG
eukprot:gene6514-10522_t